jgi:DNA-binding response OmpR family regulator
MLTARSQIPDKIEGLDSGADDYMTKPFSPAEMLAHLRALTRRTGQVVFETLRVDDLELNLESHDLSREGKSINLSFKEFSIMNILMTNKGQIVSNETLISKVWGIESSAVDNNVEAYRSFLRKKLKFLGSTAQIETIRKVGYRLISAE